MGNRVFACAATGAFTLAMSFGASAQQGPASAQGAPPPLPALPPPAPAPPSAAPAPPVVAWSAASGIELRLDGHDLHVKAGTSEAVLDIGCAGRASLQEGDRAFVACGVGGVVEVDLSNPLAPRRVGSMPVDGEATGLFARSGRVWVEIAHYSAQPVRTDGVVEAPSPEPPPVAAQVKPSILAPPRRGGLWELSAEAGAFVNLGPTSGGAVAWASAVYRFDVPVVVRFELAPIGFGVGNGISTTTSSAPSTGFGIPGENAPSRPGPGSGSIAVGALQALVGIDTQFVEMAIGGGAATLDNMSNTGTSTGGASVVAEARFGAHDGLALTLESIVVGANGQFQLASFVTAIQVPISSSVMLVARGGGGNVGILYGDLGARVVLTGDGGKDTVAVTGFFGGEGLDFTGCPSVSGSGAAETCPYASLGGPAIGGGIEWRR
jgi:hypothetical protein